MSIDWVDLLIKTGVSAAIFFLALYLGNFTFKLVDRVAKRRGRPLKTPNTVRLVFRVFFILIAIMIILSVIFNDIVPVITGLGISGIIIGFALQEPLSNIISGIFLIVGKVIGEGDVVNAGNTTGVVEMVNINHTIIRTFDGKRTYIPNKQVWMNPVTHYWPTNIRRMEVIVGVPYGQDIEKVLRALENAVNDNKHVVKEGVKNLVVFSGFNSSSIDFKIYYWFNREDYFAIQNSMSQNIYNSLKNAGISIPYPQLDIHVVDFQEMERKEEK